MAHIQKNAPKQHATQWLEFLLSVYVVDILNIAPELQDIFLKVIRALFEQYTTMLHQRILICKIFLFEQKKGEKYALPF